MSDQLAQEVIREMARRLGPRVQVAAVAHGYPNDITRMVITVRGQAATGVVTNTQHVYQDGNYVYVMGPDANGIYYIIGLADSFVNSGWFDPVAGEIVDFTQPQGPVAGFRLPIDQTNLWEVVFSDPNDPTRWGRNIAPRIPEGGDAYPVRITAGNNHHLPVATYGQLATPGDRIRTLRPLDRIPPPDPFCLPIDAPCPETVVDQQDAVFKAEALVGLGKPTGEFGVRGGSCRPYTPDTPTLRLGAALPASHEVGFNIEFGLIQPDDNGEGDFLYLKRSEFEPERFFAIGWKNRKIVVRIIKELLVGSTEEYEFDPVYNSAGGCIKFIHPITSKEAAVCQNWATFKFTYYSNGDGTSTLYSPGGGIFGSYVAPKTYIISGQIAGGYPLDNMILLGGDIPAEIVGPLKIYRGKDASDIYRSYPLRLVGPVKEIRGRPGEIGWHVWGGRYVADPNGTDGIAKIDPDWWAYDILNSGLYFCFFNDLWVFMRGSGALLKTGDAPIDSGTVLGPGLPPAFPDHNQLGHLADSDDHPQYANVGRMRSFLTQAGATLDDIVDSPTRVTLSPSQKTQVLTGTTALTSENISSQIDGIKRAFTTTVTFVAGTLQILLNQLTLRNGIDYIESLDHHGFEIDLRTPQSASPKDVLVASYRPA